VCHLIHLCSGASDEYCPHCDNHFVLDAVTPKNNAPIAVKTTDVRMDDSMLKDERMKGEKPVTIFDPDLDADKLG